MRKLESFQTRNTFSEPKDPALGIQAARRWLLEEFKSYSSRLQVRLDSHQVQKHGNLFFRDADVVNVVAVLPGVRDARRQILVTAHYDSIHFMSKAVSTPGDGPELDPERSSAEPLAPGASDNASGTAAVLELARVMSRHEFDATLVFVAFDAEEYLSVGSNLYAGQARRENQRIEAVLNNDIIGTEVSGDGRAESRRVRLFSEDPADSPSRNLARYVKRAAERYVPSMTVELIFRHDRFSRQRPHAVQPRGICGCPLHERRGKLCQSTFRYGYFRSGVAIVCDARYADQCRRADLHGTGASGTRGHATRPNRSPAGSSSAQPGAGKSGYAAHLRWRNENPVQTWLVTKCSCVPPWRPIGSARSLLGNVLEYVMEGVSIDDVVFGVQAVNKDGHESLIVSYVAKPFPKLMLE